LKYGASIDAQNGAPLIIAAKLGAISLLQTMLQGRKAAHSSLFRSVTSLLLEMSLWDYLFYTSPHCNELSPY